MRRSVPDQQAEVGREFPARAHVHLLGPVRLVGPEGPVALSDEPALLLGLLALRAGEPVPVAELTAATCTDAGPGGDHRPLDEQVRLLAAALERCGSPGALEIRPTGYLLRLPGRRIDAHRFTRLVARARDRMAAGELAVAIRLFTAALATWPEPMTGDPGGHPARRPGTDPSGGPSAAVTAVESPPSRGGPATDRLGWSPSSQAGSAVDRPTLPLSRDGSAVDRPGEPSSRCGLVDPSVPGVAAGVRPAAVAGRVAVGAAPRPHAGRAAVPKRPGSAPCPSGTGDPLSGCRLHPSGWAAAAVGRLVQARVAAIEDRWECALRIAVTAHATAGGPVADRSVVAAGVAAGRLAGEAVVELEAALVRHPLRARLWELLLVAAFLATGRRAAAEVERRARHTFREQLGIEPAGRLGALAEAAHRGELAEDWATDPRPEPVPAVAADTPAFGARPNARAPLPVPLTPLLGRDELLAEVGRQLTTHRLVTLTGPGGAGKTRLAVAAARRVAELTAWFVDLSAVESPVRVPEAVATALGVRDETGRDAVESLAGELGSVRALLVLDNCEHLVAGCAELVDWLLPRCPGLRVLATSRVALRVPDEARVPVPPLAVPAAGAGHSIATLADHPATRLFLERARAFSGRPVPEASADAVAQVCAELDGLPLAIELAAARTPLLTVDEIVARLRADLRLLRSPDPTAPSRHRSLAAVVESSVEQLDPDARRLFERLAICAGGFDAEIAEAIGGVTAPVALAALVEASLVEASLVEAIPGDPDLGPAGGVTGPPAPAGPPPPRGGSVVSGDAAALAGEAAGAPAGAGTAPVAVRGGAGAAPGGARAASVDSVGVPGGAGAAPGGAVGVAGVPGGAGAIPVADGTGAAGLIPVADGTGAAGLIPVADGTGAAGLTPVGRAGTGRIRYRMLAPVRRHALARLAATGGEVAARQALAAYCLGLAQRADARLRGTTHDWWLARLRAEATNLRAAMAWLAEAGAGGPAHGDLRLSAALAMYCRLEGHYREGRAWLAAALARHPDAPAELRARAGTGAAMLAMLLCDYPAAIEHAELARAACRVVGDRRAEARVEQILGSVAREQARYADSANHLAAAGAIFAECGDEWGEARIAELRGFTAWLSGDLDRAESRLRASLRRHQRLGDAQSEADALMNLGAVALYRGDIDRAASLLDVAMQRYSAIGFPEGVAWAHHLRGLVELRGRRTGRAAAHLRVSLAAHRKVGDRWRTASVLEALAEVARLDGEPVRGARLLGAAARIRDEIGAPVPACERPDAESTRVGLRAVLRDDGYTAAYLRGRESGLDGLLRPGVDPERSTRRAAGVRGG